MSFSQLTVRAIYDHKAEIKEEINIQCGDKLTLIDSSKQWWLVKKNGKFGYVPNNFVEIDNLRVKSKYNSNLDMPGVLRMQVCLLKNFHILLSTHIGPIFLISILITYFLN